MLNYAISFQNLNCQIKGLALWHLAFGIRQISVGAALCGRSDEEMEHMDIQ